MNARILSSGKWLGIAVICLLQLACSPDKLQSNNTELTELYIDSAFLDQVFQSTAYDYSASVGYLSNSVRIYAIAEEDSSSVTINSLDSDANGSRFSLNEGDNTFNVIVTAANGDQQTYTLTVNRATLATLSNTAYIKSFNTDAEDRLGLSVAIAGDLMAAGAPYEDTGNGGINVSYDESALLSGAVYVYVNYFGTWVPDAFLKAETPEASDAFGWSIAISGNTLVVGAPFEDSASTGVNSTRNDDGSADDSGAAFVFVRDTDGFWVQQAYLKASNTGTDDWFGYSVAIDGDTIIVGAIHENGNNTGVNSTPNDDGNADNSGAAYVFVRDSNGNWTQQAYLKPDTVEAGASFGIVSISGDSIAAGAPLKDNGGIANAGSAYVFTRDENQNWAQQARILPNNPGDTDVFGSSLSIFEDSLAVGAPLEDSQTYGINTMPFDPASNLQSGAVYTYERSDNQWTQHSYIKAELTGTTNDDDQFGYSVALHGDHLLVGAPREDSVSTGINSAAPDESAGESGAAYYFTRDANGAWSQELYIKQPDTSEAGDNMGWSVSTYGDQIAVGAYRESGIGYGVNDVYFNDGSTPNAGAAYIYR